MDLRFINKEEVAKLLPMNECIEVIEKAFRSLANKECTQPLRSLMWLPDKSGLLGMMPGHSEGLGVMGIKVISVFHSNREAGLPSHQGVVLLFDAKHGQPLMSFDAGEITVIRTAAASAVATRVLARENASVLAVIGSGEQAGRHIEAISLVRNLKEIRIWSRQKKHAIQLADEFSSRYGQAITVSENAEQAVSAADIICTVTSSKEPLIKAEWISPGTHLNAVGSSTPMARELDSATIKRAKLFTDCYESLLNEGGDFLIPKKEGAITENHIQGEVGEVLTGKKNGRENDEEITIFKSLGISTEDIFSAWHIWKKIEGK